MNIDYVGRHYTIDDKVRTFAETKLKKIFKFLDEPVEARITVASEKHRHSVELHIAHKHGVLQADEEHDLVLDALNLAIDKVEKQARRSKSKAVDKRRRASRSADGQNHWPMDVLEAESLGSGEPPRVIKSSRLEIKPMSIDDAALALTSSKNDFIVFREAGTERIHVLYRRRDQNLGLISPELEA